MKHYLHALLLMASMGIYAQDINKCGLDDNPALTDEEAAFLNEYFSETDRKGFDFTGKKVLILGGSAATTLRPKSQYFKSLRERMQVTDAPASTYPYPFTEEEKAKSGYDVIITLWTKVGISAEKKKRVIRRIAQGIWQVPGEKA